MGRCCFLEGGEKRALSCSITRMCDVDVEDGRTICKGAFCGCAF